MLAGKNAVTVANDVSAGRGRNRLHPSQGHDEAALAKRTETISNTAFQKRKDVSDLLRLSSGDRTPKRVFQSPSARANLNGLVTNDLQLTRATDAETADRHASADQAMQTADANPATTTAQ